MTSSHHMLWMLDEYETIYGERIPDFITGKPVGMGGSVGRLEAAGYGLVFALREALKELNVAADGTTPAFKGSATCQHAARLFEQLGGASCAFPAGTRRRASLSPTGRSRASRSTPCRHYGPFRRHR